MIDRAQILTRLDHERRTLARDGDVLEILPSVTRLQAGEGSHHTVIFTSLTSENAETIIAQEIEHHRQLSVGFEWKLFAHDQPPDLMRRLQRHGFEIGPREAVLILDLGTPPDWVKQADTAIVLRVDRLEQLGDFRRVAEDVFAKDYAFTANQLADALRSGSSQHRAYVAFVDGEPASVGRLYTHPDSWFGGLYGGGTRSPFRGRGLYRAIVAARAREAIQSGARYLLVDALPTSRPILERLGFQWLTDTWPYEWRP